MELSYTINSNELGDYIPINRYNTSEDTIDVEINQIVTRLNSNNVLGLISKEAYGYEKYWFYVANYNSPIHPCDIQAGTTLRVPHYTMKDVDNENSAPLLTMKF